MDELGRVALLALVPALGNLAGAVAAEVFASGPRSLNLALHAAAGIVMAVVAVELMPRVLDGVPTLAAATAFSLGGVGYLAIEGAVERLSDNGRSRAGMWMIFAAVSIDLFSDGLLIGSGSAVSLGLALVLAAGQTLADVPEGFATVANFKAKGVPRARRMMLSASLIVPAVAAAALSWSFLRDKPESWKLGALAFVAGLLMVAAAEEMMSEAHESREDTRYSVLAFIGGFALFMLTSAAVGE